MSKHKKPKTNQALKKQKKTKSKNTHNRDLLGILDNYFTKKRTRWFWIFFAISALFTFLLFDIRVSVGGDDSAYIIRAYDLIKDFKYPAFQGPLYPIILSIFVGLFGINLFVLKVLSSVFLLGHLYFLLIAFKDRIPSAILVASLILLSLNSYLIFYGSQTYSETLFLMSQMLFFVFFFRFFIDESRPVNTNKDVILRYLSLGAIVLGLGLIKSIGFSALFAVIIYFVFVKDWKAIGFSLAGFFSTFGIWQFVKWLLWSDKKAQFSDQASTLFQKHPYDASQGMETFGGFIQRFIDNSNIYLSRQYLKVMGLRPELVESNGTISAAPELPFFTILIYLVLIVAFIWAIRQNKYLLFTGIYLAAIMGVTFIMLQTLWEGTRLMIAFFPLLMLFLMAGCYYLFKFKQLKSLQFIFPAIVIILLFSEFKTSKEKIEEHQKVFRSHLRGNITAGLTPDWVNYINMCKWAAENVPEDKQIASRKPSIAFIYTSKRFHGIYKISTQDPDSLLNYLYDNKIEYVVMASLRKIEARKTQYTINTIQRYLYYIQQKYPEKIRPIHQIGTDEPAYLFKIE